MCEHLNSKLHSLPPPSILPPSLSLSFPCSLHAFLSLTHLSFTLSLPSSLLVSLPPPLLPSSFLPSLSPLPYPLVLAIILNLNSQYFHWWSGTSVQRSKGREGRRGGREGGRESWRGRGKEVGSRYMYM